MSNVILYYVPVISVSKIEKAESIDEFVQLLYYNMAEFISQAQVKKIGLDEDYLKILRKLISKYDKYVPLYDINSDQIYLIHKDNVYPRINIDFYRFINENFYNNLLQLPLIDISDTIKNNIRILSHYDLPTLKKTYVKIFYDSFIINSYITHCPRPSFSSGMDHITPYYTTDEIYYLAYDWNLTTKTTLSESEIDNLCTQISNYDISAQTLLDHQIYIYDSKAIGLVKHYSLFGSYYMNYYLRKNKCCLDLDLDQDQGQNQEKKLSRSKNNSDISYEQPLVNYEQPLVSYEQPLVSYEQPLVSRGQPLVSRGQPLVSRGQPLVSSNKKNYEDFTQNLYLDNQINIMINLIKDAPSFSKSYTVYRFIQKDDYMKHLQIGDIYQDSSFMSTTRNPFYYKNNCLFGYILIKIKLPKDIKGIGLCIESYSNFPLEEEIILPPTSKYRLDNVIDTSESTHFHGIFEIAVKKKYEFTWVGNSYIKHNTTPVRILMPGAFIPELKEIDMNQLLLDGSFKNITISDRLKYFRERCVNINNQFMSIIGNTKYVFNMESYDSTGVYKPFFYYELTDGIMITTSNSKYGNINVLMEINQKIQINYYFRFSVNDPNTVVDLNNEDWINWLSMFAYIIGIRTVVIHSNYVLKYVKTDTISQKQMRTRYPYSENIYLYMTEKKKMFRFNNVITNFEYPLLDYLFTLPIVEVVKQSDRNELYRVSQLSTKTNMGDLYIFIVDNYPKFINLYLEKIDTLFDPDKNPFRNVNYSVDGWWQLYNKGIIKHIPSEKEFVVRKGSFKKLIGDKKIPKFKNRLRSYLVEKTD